MPVHVDGRRGVDGEVFRDAVEQRDLAFIHIVQEILHRFILRPAALRDVVRPAASFAVLTLCGVLLRIVKAKGEGFVFPLRSRLILPGFFAGFFVCTSTRLE